MEDFVTLGPLGTALASKDRPRAVLIDEIDKSDLDLPGDLLHVLESGRVRHPAAGTRARRTTPMTPEVPVTHRVRGADRATYEVTGGVVRRTICPVIVLTSNGERTFPPPFLRRCVRFEMPTPSETFLENVVAAHLGEHRREAAGDHPRVSRHGLVGARTWRWTSFEPRLPGHRRGGPGPEARLEVERILLEELSGR